MNRKALRVFAFVICIAGIAAGGLLIFSFDGFPPATATDWLLFVVGTVMIGVSSWFLRALVDSFKLDGPEPK